MSKPATVPLPEEGKLNPQSILIAVVFPAPFAPRNPKISPLGDIKRNIVDGCEISKTLGEVSHLYDRFHIHRYYLSLTQNLMNRSSIFPFGGVQLDIFETRLESSLYASAASKVASVTR